MSGRPAAGRPLRIAIIGHKGIPALHGGIERHVDEIARGLVRRGHQVDAFNRGYHPYGGREYEGVRIRRRPSLVTKHGDAGTHTAFCVLEAALWRQYDIIHIHGIGPGFFTGVARAFVPTIFTFHAQDYRQQKWGRAARGWLRRGESMAVRHASAVICVSRLLQAYVHTRYGREALYVPNGARIVAAAGRDALRQWNLEPQRYVLFVGRLISDRGLPALLEAHAGIPGAPTLVIVGDSQDQAFSAALRAQARPNVVFTGYQSGEALSELYAHAQLCVHPSEVEGLPIAVLEAMSHGRPVLVSDIPENLEAVGEAGARFAVQDVAALRAAMARLLDDPAELARLGAMARARVAREYDWERITAATEQVYRVVLGDLPRSGLDPASNRLQALPPT